MAIFLRHTGCDKCGSSDARAIYSDSSEYCFSCGWSSSANAATFVPTFAEETDEEIPLLPSDLSHDFPAEVFHWLQPTGLTIAELIRNGYFYSRSERGLVRVLGSARTQNQDYGVPGPGPVARRSAHEIRRGYGGLSRGLQARISGPKTLFRGSKEQANGKIQLQDGARSEALCIVEDSISAIKCARAIDSIPLFGSSISNNKLTKITKEYQLIYVWLDSDKLNNARLIADRIRFLGKKAEVVFTELDPKYTNGNPYDPR